MTTEETLKNLQDQIDEIKKNYVPTSTCINNKPLSGNIELGYEDTAAMPREEAEPSEKVQMFTQDGWDINITKIGYKLIYARIMKTFDRLSRQDMVNQGITLPFSTPRQYKLSGTIMVAAALQKTCVGYVSENQLLIATDQDFEAPVSVEIYGVIGIREDI